MDPAVASVVVAVISGCFALALGAINKNVKKAHSEVKTNHGQPASYYLELIAEVVNEQKLQGKRTDDILERLSEQSDQLERHTEQDARNFAELRVLVGAVNIASKDVGSA